MHNKNKRLGKVSLYTGVLPDELMFSALSRFNYESLRTTAITNNDLYNKYSYVPLIHITGMLEKLYNSIGDPWTPETILNNHTVYRYYASFILDERKHLGRKEYIDGNARYGKYFLGMKETSIKNTKLLFCPICAKEDISIYGFPYFHREHFLQGVFMCPHHKVLLNEYKLKENENLNNYIRMDPNMLDFNIQYNEHYSQYYKVFDYAYKILCLESSLSKEISALKIKSLLYDNNYIDSRGKVKRTQLEKDLINYYKPDDFIYNEFNLNRDKPFSELAANILSNKQKFNVSPIKFLLIIAFLSETFDDFINARKFEWSSKPINYSEEKTQKYRRTILNYITQHSNDSRTEIYIANSRQITYLNKYDNAWLESVLPESKRAPVKNNKNHNDFESLDSKSCFEVENAYKKLLDKNEKIRITKSHIFQEAGIPYHYINKLPQTKLKVEELAESPYDYAKRKCINEIDRLFSEGKRPRIQSVMGPFFAGKFRNELRSIVELYIQQKLCS